MDKQSAIFTRYSVRDYDADRRATQEQIDDILFAAMSAPTAMNKRPWEFVVAMRPEILRAIMKIHPYCASLADAGCAITVCADLNRQYKTSDGGFYIYDCFVAAENILIRAGELGLSTCLCGIEPNAKRVAGFKKLFGLPENIQPVALIVLGYAKCCAAPVRKFDASVVHREKW